MASASDHRAHAALQPADCLILLPQRLPAAAETSIGPAHYPAECTQSDAFLQPSLRARKGRANSNSFRARISPEIVLFALAAGSALRQLSPCDYIDTRFRDTEADCKILAHEPWDTTGPYRRARAPRRYRPRVIGRAGSPPDRDTAECCALT